MTHRELQTELLIIGAGLGGVAAALAACKSGRSVILTEETDWIGGQLTSQAVPPDEHPWIEHTGATGSYREMRNRIRDYYRRNYPLLPSARNDPFLNPGKGHVSALCHEPRVALAVLHEMLAPYISNGQLSILLNSVPSLVESDGDLIRSVTLDQRQAGTITVAARYVLDATETGELLELGGIDHVIGAESQEETDELHAPAVADPLDQQAVSWCFPLSYHPDGNHVIGRPETYEFWRDYQADFWPDKQFSWYDLNPETLTPRHKAIFAFPEDGPRNDFWHYRRIVFAGHYAKGFTHDVTLVNWPQIDYWLGPLVGVDEATRNQHLEGAKQLSLSFLYWMQTEAPRHDGGTGYPELKLRPDIVGTADGLAKAVYIREARRIRARFTVTEEHVGVEQREQMGLSAGAAAFDDSVGVGFYRIDLHPSTALRTYVDIASHPFQIPMGALIPQRVENLLPAGKNIGTTHITNGCYRLHPVEWNIGEAAGVLAAHALETGESPTAIYEHPQKRDDFRTILSQKFRVPLSWPQYTYSPDMGSWYQHAHEH